MTRALATRALVAGPLHSSVERLDAAIGWLAVRVGLPEEAADGPAWVRCTDVDAAFLAGWEERMAGTVTRTCGRTHPMTVSGFCLDGYAGLPGQVGGALFRLARRVPRVDRASLAFRCDPEEHHPDGIALLDPRFWCLPGDPDADHPAATVVADEAELAAVLRTQVRAHADEFLAGYRGGARLPRRGLLGAFYDGLDTGVWFGGDPEDVASVAEAAAVLPGGTVEFAAPSSLYRFVDVQDREHISRRRVGCCYYFKVADDGLACSTCPRVDDAERVQRYSQLP
ncbi:(2Fe-2S)-binding protein [Pseudonocardia broussonetiae]|uniref:(2Fe-2S)-binding protein n=1 Tax=Pseudonocardia broussonetiae TaxID=2736640 RepID=A0A6M6JJT5_9PSEU|nr:(2Fe-2S)-binding protein [Pseudonocardia broussonetiae]QJY48318.1 (2Fe-2S)-binding protein [Pseudonocardia broussonetiae]